MKNLLLYILGLTILALFLAYQTKQDTARISKYEYCYSTYESQNVPFSHLQAFMAECMN